MSRAPTAAVPASRPGFLDFFLLLTGCAVSLLLARLPLLPQLTPNEVPFAADLLPQLLTLVRLPEGVILLWPVFYLLQLAFGRSQGLTAGEWLWILAWLGTVLVTALAALLHAGLLPESVRPHVRLWPPVVWYFILVPSLALVAVVLAIIGLFRREPPPWTHPLGLALLVWPALPLAGLLVLAKIS